MELKEIRVKEDETGHGEEKKDNPVKKIEGEGSGSKQDIGRNRGLKEKPIQGMGVE